jgi:hypothetical protein
MLPWVPATLYRPTKTDRDSGTYDETLSDGRTIYVIIVVHESLTVARVSRDTDIMPEDQLVVDGAGYRVTGSVLTMSANVKEMPVERTSKPIVPVPEDLSS